LSELKKWRKHNKILKGEEQSTWSKVDDMTLEYNDSRGSNMFGLHVVTCKYNICRKIYTQKYILHMHNGTQFGAQETTINRGPIFRALCCQLCKW
jgi:hypothetical protein